MLKKSRARAPKVATQILRGRDIAAVETMPTLMLRDRDVAAALAVSKSLVAVFVRKGWLTPVRMPGIRLTRFSREDVEALAAKIRSGALE